MTFDRGLSYVWQTSIDISFRFSGKGLNHRDSTLIISSTFSRCRRYVIGNPQMLLVLVRVFESRRGVVVDLVSKSKNNKNQRLRTPSVGKRNSTRVDKGRRG